MINWILRSLTPSGAEHRAMFDEARKAKKCLDTYTKAFIQERNNDAPIALATLSSAARAVSKAAAACPGWAPIAVEIEKTISELEGYAVADLLTIDASVRAAWHASRVRTFARAHDALKAFA
jgi:hypothetical protein